MPRWQPPGLARPGPARRPGVLLAELTARPFRLALALAATVAAAALIGAWPGSAAGARTATRAAPRVAGLPADVRTVRAAAAVCPGLDWRVLLAMYEVESDRGALSGRSSAGAVGPMQFMPATWREYGTDGDGDGTSQVGDLADAATAAARMLCADGARTPAGLRDALWSYNHSDDYVARVISTAATLPSR